MGHISWFQKKLIFVPVLLFLTLIFFLYKSCQNDGKSSLLAQTREDIRELNLQISKLKELQGLTINNNYNNSYNAAAQLPTIYFITPTYSRYTQQADLIRLSNTLKHVPQLHWIVVEDAPQRTSLVENLLKASGLLSTHLNTETQGKLVRKKNEQRWKRHRGVDQRNHALAWIRTNLGREREGVVYFGDDDNTYHLDLFSEMRTTKIVSMWPVALVGGLRFEGPICEGGRVREFFTAWMPERQFPVDMAAFAVNLNLLTQHHPTAAINPEVARGFLETDFLQQLKINVEDIEAKGNDCSKILVWHTQTAKANMKEEEKLRQKGLPGSDLTVIV